MNIEQIEQILRNTKPTCHGGDCVRIFRTPCGSIWTRDFNTYGYYNKITNTTGDGIGRNEILHRIKCEAQQKKIKNILLPIGLIAAGVAVTFLLLND